MSNPRELASIQPPPINISLSDLQAAFRARPETAAAGLAALASWATVERSQLQMFAQLMGGNESMVLTAYRAVGELGRDRAIVAVARRVLNDEEWPLFEALRRATGIAIKERHRLAHWIWGHSSSIDDAFILFDPEDALADRRPPKHKGLVYSTAVFQKIIENHESLYVSWSLLGLAIGIRQSLEARGEGTTTPKRDSILVRVRTSPLVADALRTLTAKKERQDS